MIFLLKGDEILKRVIDIYKEKEKEGEIIGQFCKLDEILDNELEILDMKKLQGDYGYFYYVIAKLVDDMKIVSFNIGGSVAMKVLNRIDREKDLPLRAKIQKKISKKGLYYYIIA